MLKSHWQSQAEWKFRKIPSSRSNPSQITRSPTEDRLCADYCFIQFVILSFLCAEPLSKNNYDNPPWAWDKNLFWSWNACVHYYLTTGGLSNVNNKKCDCKFGLVWSPPHCANSRSPFRRSEGVVQGAIKFLWTRARLKGSFDFIDEPADEWERLMAGKLQSSSSMNLNPSGEGREVPKLRSKVEAIRNQ